MVRKGNMAAIAADSLTTFGDTRLSDSFDASSEKMVRYGDTVIAFCGSAMPSTGLRKPVFDLEGSELQQQGGNFRDLPQAARHPRDQHFLNPKEETRDAYESTHITALIASRTGIYGIYSMRVFRVQTLLGRRLGSRIRAGCHERALRPS